MDSHINFETNAPKDPQNEIHLYNVQLHITLKMYVSLSPDLQSGLLYCQLSLNHRPILRPVDEMTDKEAWTLKGQRYLIRVYWVTKSKI